MNQYQDTTGRWKKILYSKWMLLILLIFVGFLVRSTWGIYQKDRQSGLAAAAANKELADMQARYNTLESNIERLNTPEGVQEEIRSKYGVAMPGEDVIIIENSTTSASSTLETDESWWGKFKGLFK